VEEEKKTQALRLGGRGKAITGVEATFVPTVPGVWFERASSYKHRGQGGRTIPQEIAARAGAKTQQPDA
jgi:hypothetical protein